jgi:anaerobic selenocysteine-containing dehydrogenase/Fe-S-cluster-containing dehydrogenase component
MPEIDRRNFLKLIGVSAGAAAATGCSDPVEKLIPYVVQPEEITPGLAVIYASTCQECPAGCGLHVRTREGRPIKLEGNPNHPVNQGALCARGQAGLGRTYLPDRYAGPMQRQADGQYAPISWSEAHALLAKQLGKSRGRTRILTGETGPTLTGLIDRWIDAVGSGKRVVYEPFDYTALKEASSAVFGPSGKPVFDLSKSDFVIDFGSDFLESWVSPIEHGRQFSQSRSITDHPGGGAPLVYVGSRLSMTAGNADEWLPAKPGTEGILALGIAKAALDHAASTGVSVPAASAVASLLRKYGANSVSSTTEVPAAVIKRLGMKLLNAQSPVALPPGIAVLTENAVSTTSAVLILNAVIGAIGKTVLVTPETADSGQADNYREVASVVTSMQAGKVGVLLIHDSNPVYSMPAASGFAAALAKVEFVVSTASSPDETSERAHLILPDHTPMESWGDHAPRPGVRSLVQPTIRPLHDTQAFGDTLIETAKAMGNGSKILGSGADAQLPSTSFREVLEQAWSDTDFRAALAAGGTFSDASVGDPAEVAATVANLTFKAPRLKGDGLTLLPIPSPLLSDGSGSSLPWLQETPDPVMKVTWQSWAEVSKSTAATLGVEYGDVVSVETSAGTVELPILPRGGIRDDVIAIAIGQGHSVGFYASKSEAGSPGVRGVSVISILPAVTDERGGRAWLTTKAQVRATGAHRRIPKTQEFDNKRGRELGDAISLVALAQAGEQGSGGHGAVAADHGGGHGEGHEMIVDYDPADDSDENSPYRWGMTIDIDRCNGCSACIVACSIENNVINVGEEMVLLDRQMQWIRIERYIGAGDQELITGRNLPTDHEELGNTDVRHSPMMCQQCGAAPCEPVCPVFATYHNPEGLNGMIYNRCIGTRYCSNNCPYKVRRYNWFDYAIENIHEPMNLMMNPDVTVRGQGVMEKCTFCVQRIENGRQLAKDEGRPIADGEVTTACAQTCPTQAITFGNLKDKESNVVKRADASQARSYRALQVLNTRPSIAYLKKVTRGPEGMEG